MACATDGIEFPCCDEVGLISAPVAMNKTFLSSPISILGRIYPHSTLALHPQPLPPEWVSWLSGSKIMAPQSL